MKTLADYKDMSLESLQSELSRVEAEFARAYTEESSAIRRRLRLELEQEAIEAAIMKLEGAAG